MSVVRTLDQSSLISHVVSIVKQRVITASGAMTNATQALDSLQTLINQLIESGMCTISGGGVDCGNSVAFGGGTVADDAENAVAIGEGANVQSSGGIAMGHNAKAIESNSVAIGAGATALSSVAVGTNAQATGTNTTAVGDNAVASGEYAAAFGNEAQATHDNSVAIGNGSTTSAPDTVSVGSAGHERRITHVAPGTDDTDAVNVRQFQDGLSNVGGESLEKAKAYTDQEAMAARAYAAQGIAATAAIINLQPSAVGKTAIGVGMGYFDGYVALGLSFAKAPGLGSLISGGVAFTNGGNAVARAGVAFEY